MYMSFGGAHASANMNVRSHEITAICTGPATGARQHAGYRLVNMQPCHGNLADRLLRRRDPRAFSC
jgi:hypothetical protein